MTRCHFTIFITLLSLLVLTGCDGGPSGSRSQAAYQAPSHSSPQHRGNQRSTNSQQMIRQVNGIVEQIDQVEQRLREKLDVLRQEQQQMERLKEDAKTAYMAGQIADSRAWQRIARDKYRNIRAELVRSENTIAAVRNDASSQLRRVNWVSGVHQRRHRAEVQRELSQLGQWESEIQSLLEKATSHEQWLESEF